jgi:hypothetical protein
MEIAVIGLILGFIIGITGLGGGMLTTPILIIFLDVPTVTAVGTSLIFASVTKVAAASVYIYRRLICTKLTTFLALGSIPGAILGSYSLHFFNKNYPFFVNKIMPVLIFLLIFISVSFSIYKTFSKNDFLIDIDIRNKPYLISLLGFIVGFEIGLTSIGSGVLITAILMAVCPLITSKIIGTDIVHGLILSIVAGSIHYSVGHVDAYLATHLIIGGIVGALLGAFLSPRIPQDKLKISLNLCILILGFVFLIKTI